MNWRDIPSLTSLRAFDVTARERSFSGAARVLNVTPAAVMQQVRALETDFGLPLVRRYGRGIALTTHGEQLAQILSEAFNIVDTGIRELRSSSVSGSIQVSATPNVVSEILMVRLAEFWEKHRDVEVSITPCPNHLEASEGFDVAIRAGTGDFPDFEAVHLLETRWVVVVAPDRALADPSDFTGLTWVRNPSFAFQAALIRQAGVDPDEADIAGIVSPGHELQAVKEGLGAAIYNAFLVRRDVRAGRLLAYELSNMPRVAYWAVTPKGPTRQATNTFIKWLKFAMNDELAKHIQAGT